MFLIVNAWFPVDEVGGRELGVLAAVPNNLSGKLYLL